MREAVPRGLGKRASGREERGRQKPTSAQTRSDTSLLTLHPTRKLAGRGPRENVAKKDRMDKSREEGLKT